MIFAKALQKHLQPLLVEVIDNDKTLILPLPFFWDNIMLTRESIQWAKKSHQISIFFKLDFSKDYDRVEWTFMFQVIKKLGVPSLFIHMIRLLFQNVVVSVKINNQVTKPFAIRRDVRQGCPLAPYLFIIVVEPLNIAIKNAINTNLIKCIFLPQCNLQQIISQYVDYTLFTVTTDETTLINLVKILKISE